MGVVDFDPEKWSRTNGSDDAPGVAKVARLAEVRDIDSQQSRLSQLSQAPPLPSDLRAGLIALRSMQAPRKVNVSHWRLAVSDALRLAGEGWVAKALALGWSPLDLLGAVADPGGDLYSDGLAVWLEGRPLLALTDEYAVADDGNGGRSYFNRMVRSGACLLWDLGQ